MSTSSAEFDPKHLNDVAGLVAVVTGAYIPANNQLADIHIQGGTGLGLIIAKTLEANGAKVYITGRRQEKLDEAVKQAVHGNIHPIQGSTTSHADLQRAVSHITHENGHIDLLICNAGQTSYDSSPNARPIPQPGEASISEIRDYYFNYRPASTWNQVLETNVSAVFTTTMAFLELLDAGNKRREKGMPTSQVIAIGSVGGLVRFTHSFIYNASKAAVHHLMKNLGNLLVEYDIRTNVIAPGWFPSDMTIPVAKAWEHSNGVMPRSLVPTQRMGNVEELAGTVLYLAGRSGGYCNGNVMVIDGGVLANHAGTY